MRQVKIQFVRENKHQNNSKTKSNMTNMIYLESMGLWWPPMLDAKWKLANRNLGLIAIFSLETIKTCELFKNSQILLTRAN